MLISRIPVCTHYDINIVSYLEHEYLVSMYDGGESVCDNDGGLPLTDLQQGRLDVPLCLCVQSRGGLI